MQRHALGALKSAARRALVGVVFGLFELVLDEIQLAVPAKSRIGKTLRSVFFEAGDVTVLRARSKELLMLSRCNLDQVSAFPDTSWIFAENLCGCASSR